MSDDNGSDSSDNDSSDGSYQSTGEVACSFRKGTETLSQVEKGSRPDERYVLQDHEFHCLKSTLKCASSPLKGQIYPAAVVNPLSSSSSELVTWLRSYAEGQDAWVYVQESLSTEVEEFRKPPQTLLWDICVVSSKHPLVVLSVGQDEDNTSELRNYNAGLARLLIIRMKRAGIQRFNLMKGVINLSVCSTVSDFQKLMLEMNDVAHKCSPLSLKMNKKVYSALLSVILPDLGVDKGLERNNSSDVDETDDDKINQDIPPDAKNFPEYSVQRNQNEMKPSLARKIAPKVAAREENMNTLPACQVCHQQFSLKGPAPFLLPCLHSVCETCVNSTPGGLISCSACQIDVNLTETRLQKDVVRQKKIRHLTVEHNPELVLCTHEDDGSQAVCWCKECDDFMCEYCERTHDAFKATGNHVVYNITELQADSYNVDRYCQVHPKMILDTWDKDCHILTCGKCRHGDHAGHEGVELEKAAETAREEVATLGKEEKSTVEKHGTDLEATERDIQSIHDNEVNLAEKINNMFTSLKILLDQRGKQLQISLQQLTGNMMEDLILTKRISAACYWRSQATYDYIREALQYSSMYDIMDISQMLEKKTQECRSSLPTEVYKSPPEVVFNTEGLERIKSTLAEFGVIATEGHNLPVHSKDCGIQTEDNLLQELENLKQTLDASKNMEEKLMVQRDVEEKRRREVEIQADKLNEELKESKAREEKLVREKGAAERELQDQAEKLRQELKQSKAREKKLGRERRTVERDLEAQADKLREVTKELQKSKEREQKLVREKRAAERVPVLHILKASDVVQSYLLLCTPVQLSTTKCNTDWVHINTEGELINKPDTNPPHSDQRLKKYWGTSSTVHLPQCGSPQYWEVETRLGVDKTLTGNALLLEIGLCREEEQDQHHFIHGHSHSYSLIVSHCTKHSSICRKVCRHDDPLLCLPDTLEITPGTSVTLHYGVVYDSVRSRIVFLDVKNEKMIGKIYNIDSSVDLWPMFGVYNPSRANVSMSLVVGRDIDMTERKKVLILQSLS